MAGKIDLSRDDISFFEGIIYHLLTRFHLSEVKMSNQMRISNFFNTSATKRRASDVDATSDSPQMKSPKTVDESSPESNAKRPLLNLSPEQRERMEANRKEAEKRLLANKRPQFFGASWRKALAAEFGKEYFVKVS